MILLNLIKLSALLLFITAFNISSSAKIIGADNKSKVVSGKVIYSDDNSPVRSGTIQVVKVSASDGSISIIQKAEINSSGQFTIANIIPETTDIIKIMCYPNDREDSFQFIPKETVLNSTIANSVNENGIVIKVQRAGSMDPRVSD